MTEMLAVWVMIRGYISNGKWWSYTNDHARVTRDGFTATTLVISAIERSENNWFTFKVSRVDEACQVEAIDPTTGRPWDVEGNYRSMPINQLKDAAANAGWKVLSGRYDGKEVYHVV